MAKKDSARKKPPAKATGPFLTATQAFNLAIEGNKKLISRSSFYAACRNGEIPLTLCGRRYLIPTEIFVNQWMKGLWRKTASA